MAVSALTVATVKPQTLQTHHHKPSLSIKPIANFVSAMKRPLLDVGVGVLAASVVVLSPLEATATRIEYYATVAEPDCELNYAKSGLGYCDVALGSGAEAPLGELVNVHYTARFADGRVFDSSYKRARPLTMRLGAGKLIRGLDQGILGGEGVPPMLVGGKRKLRIPPELAYGPEPAGCFSGEYGFGSEAKSKQNAEHSSNRPPYSKAPMSLAGSLNLVCLVLGSLLSFAG